MRQWIICLLLYVLVSCDVSQIRVLHESFEENWSQIYKVIDRYQREGDNQKLKAAYFLIENMPYHSYLYSPNLIKAKEWFRLMRVRPKEEWKDISDSLFANIDVSVGLERMWDSKVLDSAFICNNIDYAFKAWRELPWGKNVSFTSFCENILPYRIGDEVPENWREEYFKKFRPLVENFMKMDSIDTEDPIEAYKYLISCDPIIHDALYSSTSPFAFPHIGAKYVQFNTGTCKEFCDYLIYICRAMGIPCAFNLRLNDGHSWITFWNKNGHEYVVSYEPNRIVPVEEDDMMNTEKTRVFRLSYCLNKSEMSKLPTNRNGLPQFFQVPLFKNVTSKFTDSYLSKITIPRTLLNFSIPDGMILYLCSSQRNNWVAEDYTISCGNDITFGGIQPGCVMCVAVNDYGKMVPITEPFLVDDISGDIQLVNKNTINPSVILKSKYHIEGEERILRERMRNGVFEGANNCQFDNPDTLAIIQETPYRQISFINTYIQNKHKKYKYLRYKGLDGSYCNVAEVKFYGENGIPITFNKIIGTPICISKYEKEYMNVFDDNPSTSFDYCYPNGGWSGVELSTEQSVSKISYTPRNRVNYIYAGDQYELFYYDNGWRSMGKQTALSDSLIYYNVPDKLLYLKNHSSGVKEMVFTYQRGGQCFRGCGFIRPKENKQYPFASCRWDCRYSFLTPKEDWMKIEYQDFYWENGQGGFGSYSECATPWSSQKLYIRYLIESEDIPMYDVMLKCYLYGDCTIYFNGNKLADLKELGGIQTVTLPKDMFLEGKNIISILVVNNNYSDSAYFDMEIIYSNNIIPIFYQ